MKWILMIVFVGSVYADQCHDSEKFKVMTVACINGDNPALCLRELNYKHKLAHKAASSQKNREAQEAHSSQQDNGNITTTNETTVFDTSECVGKVVNGKCDDPILPTKAGHK